MLRSAPDCPLESAFPCFVRYTSLSLPSQSAGTLVQDKCGKGVVRMWMLVDALTCLRTLCSSLLAHMSDRSSRAASAALGEEYCFCVDHSVVVKESRALVRKRLQDRKIGREQSQGW